MDDSPSKNKEGAGDLISEEDKGEGAITILDIKNLFSFSVGNWGFFLYLFFCFTAAFF